MESLFEILLELFLQVFGDVVLEVLCRSRNPVIQAIANALLAALVGGVLSAISLAVFPRHIVRDPNVRLLLLVAVPMANGGLMAWIGRWIARRDRVRSEYEHFLPAMVFSLVFGGIRFLGAK